MSSAWGFLQFPTDAEERSFFMNETLNTLIHRRSIRKYKPDQVSEEQLAQILEAGTYAPTGMGMQSPVMVVVQDRPLIEKLSKMNAAAWGRDDIDPFYGAPTVVIVLADKSVRPTWLEDGSLVMGNLMNAAWSVGVDSCWIHRAREMFSSEEGQLLLKQWGLKGDLVGVGCCILGYRDCEVPAPKPRKEGYVVRV